MKLPQFSLREMFLLIALVAIGCGWWIERERLLYQVVLPIAPLQPSRCELVIGKEGEQMMVDTATGEMWVFDRSVGTWAHRQSPLKMK